MFVLWPIDFHADRTEIEVRKALTERVSCAVVDAPVWEFSMVTGCFVPSASVVAACSYDADGAFGVAAAAAVVHLEHWDSSYGHGVAVDAPVLYYRVA